MNFKKVANMILITIILVSVLVGCQATPETIVIKSKSAGAYASDQQNISSEPDPNSTQTHIQKDNQMWSEKFDSADLSSSINIDAEIIEPKASDYYIMPIKPMNINEEFVKEMFNGMNNGGELYRDDNIQSKREIENKLIEYKRMLNDEKNKSADEISNATINNYQNIIRDLEKQYADAPEEISTDAPNYVFEEEPEGMSIKAKIVSAEGDSIRLYAFKNNSGKGNLFLYYTDRKMQTNQSVSESSDKINLSLDGARGQAISVMERCDLSKDFQLSAQYIGGNFRTPQEFIEKGYVFYFTRNINNIPMNFVKTQDGTNAYFDSNVYDEPWLDEIVEIGIDEKGIASIQWISPSEVIMENTSKVDLLSIESIKEIIKTQLMQKYINCDPHYDINVKRLELGYARIKDEINEYVVIPVWDVFGTIDMNFDSDEIQNPLNNDNYSLITLNATDGSIIDRGLMY